MKLRTLRHRTDEMTDRFAADAAPRLHPVDRLAQIIEWPYAPSVDPEPAAAVAGEIRVKLLGPSGVSDDRYTATLHAADSSPSAILTALAAACARIEDLHRSAAPDQRLILDVSIRA